MAFIWQTQIPRKNGPQFPNHKVTKAPSKKKKKEKKKNNNQTTNQTKKNGNKQITYEKCSNLPRSQTNKILNGPQTDSRPRAAGSPSLHSSVAQACRESVAAGDHLLNVLTGRRFFREDVFRGQPGILFICLFVFVMFAVFLFVDLIGFCCFVCFVLCFFSFCSFVCFFCVYVFAFIVEKHLDSHKSQGK